MTTPVLIEPTTSRFTVSLTIPRTIKDQKDECCRVPCKMFLKWKLKDGQSASYTLEDGSNKDK